MSDALRQRGAAAAPEEPAPARVAGGDDDDNKQAKAAGGGAPAALPDDADFVTRNERWVPWVLFLVAAFTRYYRLDKPPGALPDRLLLWRRSTQRPRARGHAELGAHEAPAGASRPAGIVVALDSETR